MCPLSTIRHKCFNAQRAKTRATKYKKPRSKSHDAMTKRCHQRSLAPAADAVALLLTLARAVFGMFKCTWLGPLADEDFFRSWLIHCLRMNMIQREVVSVYTSNQICPFFESVGHETKMITLCEQGKLHSRNSQPPKTAKTARFVRGVWFPILGVQPLHIRALDIFVVDITIWV